jgi:very-short-patch-repair endonuclease
MRPETDVALRAALAIAAEQRGAISVAQLRACGLSARAQRAAVADGHLSQVEPTVLVVRGSPDTWFRRLQVGLLALGPQACVSHEAAAQLLGLEGANEDAVEFTTLRSGRSRSLRRAVVHTTRVIGRLDVIKVHGFRCTSATRTILDLAGAGARPERVEAAIDSAIRLRHTAVQVLVDRLAETRGRGRSGVRLMDRVLVDSGGESVLERAFLRLVRNAGLPRPITQRRIKRDGQHVARVDFLYADERMVIEVTGRLGHSTPADRGRDAQRRNELQDLGYAVYEYTYGDVTRRRGYVVTTLRERLAARRPVPVT